ncbi:NADP-dependent phosphogluconate dehydrogenase [Staphylococcus chromogenes]|uniref:NADP-dependent phosphogluconate dehydrogenase n=1 Tax=Staphylococcus chromogenes TaxID=46126 RepID=UPI003EC047A4
MTNDIGVIGLGVMGKNLAWNMESKGYKVSIHSLYENEIKDMSLQSEGKNIHPTYSIQDFIQSIERPRKILLMVKAGTPTDKTIDLITPYLELGDIIIDGGNTNYLETIDRNLKLSKEGINFIGMGVSGGENGALKGPSLMPGGQEDAYNKISDILIDISAKTDDGEPCVTYIGPDGSGHYVKSVHNGIEYADMQIIAESYSLMKNFLGMNNFEIADTFKKWNQGELESYLINITSHIFNKLDASNSPLVESILDTAGQKGTGKWTSINSLELGVPLTIITESVFARFISSFKNERVQASKILNGPEMSCDVNKEEFLEKIRKSLYMSKICAYAQGFSQIKKASDEHKWDLDLGEIASIWRKGCIISAQFLNRIREAYNSNDNLENLLLDEYFKDIVTQYQYSLRDVVMQAVKNGIPTPGLSASINYYDSYRAENLPANLIQAQRDYFGAHTYELKGQDGYFHTNWE